MYLLCLALVLVADAPKSKPVAMVLEVAGEATLRRGDAPAEPLRDMDLLRPGDRLEATKGHVRIVIVDDGHFERLQTGKIVTMGDKGCTPADAVERATGKLADADLRRLRGLVKSSRGGVGVLRDLDTPTVPAVTPLLGSTILTQRPTFAWPALKGAARYDVRLFSGEGKERQREWKQTAVSPEPRLSYPESEKELPLGVTRFWQVTGLDAEGKFVATIEYRFSVAAEAELARQPALRKLAESADPNDWLLAAASYEEFAAYGEALPLYQKLAGKRPEQANYQVALMHYYGRAGLFDKAEEARLKAGTLGVKIDKSKKD